MRRPLALLTLIVCTAASNAATREPTIHDEIARQLQRSFAAGATGTARGAAAISALRSLRDDKLRALFADMASSERPGQRVEGILGLAELSPDGQVNLGLIGELQSPAEQALVMLESLATGRLADSNIEAILSWPKLDPRLELALRAHLLGVGKPLDAERALVLAKDPDPLSAALAETLLLHAGDAAASGRALAIIRKLEPGQRGSVIGPIIETVAREKLTGAAPLIVSLLSEIQTEGGRAEALEALMRVSTGEGTTRWQSLWKAAAEPADQIRLALVALEVGDQTDKSILDTLASSAVEPPASIGRALLAMRTPDAPETADALVALVKQDHAPSTLWALGATKKLPQAASLQLLSGMIQWGAADREPHEGVPRVVFEAAWRIAELDATALSAPLTKACAEKDAALSEAILGGLMRAGTRPVWDPAAPPAFPGRTAQAMALLYEARLAGLKPGVDPSKPGPILSGGGFPDDPERAERLRQIALGWGSLPEAYRGIAAWLALCQDGKDREALTRLLAPDAE